MHKKTNTSKRDNLKIVRVNEQKLTKAIISETANDAENRVLKNFGICPEKLRRSHSVYGLMFHALNLKALTMSDKYSGTVICRDGDTFSENEGQSLAVKKAMNNHNRAFNKALARWQASMIRKIYEVSPSTFDEAYTKVFCNPSKGFVDKR